MILSSMKFLGTPCPLIFPQTFSSSKDVLEKIHIIILVCLSIFGYLILVLLDIRLEVGFSNEPKQ